MKQELSGFETVEIEAKFHDGYRETDNLYFWIKQESPRSNDPHIIIVPVSAWQDLDRLAAKSASEVQV